MAMYSAFEIANKLIALARQDADNNGGDLLTNMKLQKMLYYEQAYHLAAFGTPLFQEPVEAWMYGPVVPAVYERYRQYGSQPLPTGESVPTFDPDTESLIIQVYDTYKTYSAIGLMNLTHMEDPWKNATPHIRGTVISGESMERFFKSKLD